MAAPRHLSRHHRTAVILALVLGGSFLLKLHNLGDPALTCYDETFHAIVARNLLDRPFKPTLVENPYLSYDFRDWTANHVWLHKGILPLWLIAGSYSVLGVDPFALRLPSAILGTAAVWLTYLIGRRLLDRRAALVAAALQAFNPALTMLVHGYWFSDHVDTSLIFCTELGVYFLVRANRTGRWPCVLLAGVAQGLAFLCKYFPAGIILGIAVAAWLLPVIRLGRRGRSKLRFVHVLGLLLATLITIAPWTIWCLHQFPDEFRHELLHAGRHLGESIEGWGAPWDRLVFDYLIQLYREFYAPLLVAAVVLLGRAITRRDTGLWLTYAWAVGVLVPHLLAETKTPSATAMAMPAGFLLLGALISDAWRGRRSALAAWTAVMAVGLLYPAVIQPPGEGYPNPPVFAAVMRGSPWVLWHFLAALAVVALVELLARKRRVGLLGLTNGVPVAGSITALESAPTLESPANFAEIATLDASRVRHDRVVRDLRSLALAFGLLAAAVLGYRVAGATWAVVAGSLRETNRQAFRETGNYARTRLPPNAVLLVDDQFSGEHRVLQFFADRTCYPLHFDRSDLPPTTPRWRQDAEKIMEAGGIPYLVTPRKLPLTAVYSSRTEERTIYECPP